MFLYIYIRTFSIVERNVNSLEQYYVYECSVDIEFLKFKS